MSRQLIDRDFIQTCSHVESWKEAIAIAAKPMVDHGCIEASYIDAMIQTVLDLGSYIVIAPMIALPHARSNGMVHQNAISILKLEKPVFFEAGDASSQATLILPIACVDNDKHLTMLAKVAEILGEVDLVDKLLKTNDAEAIYRIFETLTFEEES